MTQSVYNQFGVPVSLINNNSPAANNFTIDLICPNILSSKVQDEMRTDQGTIIAIDTTVISQQFLLSKDSSRSSVENNNKKNNLNSQ
jgi:hypothetical protein